MSAEALVDTTGPSCSSDSSSPVLQRTFLSQRPFYVNLLDDLGAGDFFVIDGDALLLDSLSSVFRDARHGLQMLQLFYLVESFLDSLQNCLNSKFCFVFFQQYKQFWHQSPSYSLARHVLQHHLKYVLGQTVHTDFICWHSQGWLQYVEQVASHQLGFGPILCFPLSMHMHVSVCLIISTISVFELLNACRSNLPFCW